MTTHQDLAQQELPLPGLEDAPANVSPMVRALRRSIAALDRAELLEEQHALDLQAAHLLARAAELKLATGRASTIANDVDLLLRIKAQILDPGEAGTADAELRAAMDEANRLLDEAEA